MNNRKQFACLTVTIGISLLCVITILAYNAVDNSLSEEDKKFISMYLSGVGPLAENFTYEDELSFIISVQRSVLNIAPRNNGLPFGQKRELKELYEARAGLCYDRSRAIEKLLRYSGFETRHIFMLSKEKTGSALKSLITSGVSSHAVTEVLTKKGWLVVDSNAPWISIDSDKHPIPIDTIQLRLENAAAIKWRVEPPSDIYVQPYTFVYGLYSRHGYFYPPYNFIPDIQYGEFMDN